MQNAVPRGFFSLFGLSPNVRIFISDFYKIWSFLEGIFDFDLSLRGTLIFFTKIGRSSRLFLKNVAGGFRPVEWGFTP